MLTLTYVSLVPAQVMTTVEVEKIARKEYVLVLRDALHRVVQDWDAMHIRYVFLFPAGGMTSVEEEKCARKEYVFHSQVEWGQEEEAWDQEECSPKEEDKVEWDHFHQSSFMSDEINNLILFLRKM